MIEAVEVPVDENILINNPTIAEKLLIAKARDLVKYNREAAEACRQLEDYDSAEKFISATMQKISKQTDLIEVSTTLFIVAQILFWQRKFSATLPIILRALAAMEAVTPKNFDKLSKQLILLGNVYTTLDKHADVLKSFERAIAVQKQNPHPEHAIMEQATLSMCKSLMRLEHFDDAAKDLQELFAKQRNFLNETHPRIEAVKQLLQQARERKLSGE